MTVSVIRLWVQDKGTAFIYRSVQNKKKKENLNKFSWDKWMKLNWMRWVKNSGWYYRFIQAKLDSKVNQITEARYLDHSVLTQQLFAFVELLEITKYHAHLSVPPCSQEVFGNNSLGKFCTVTAIPKYLVCCGLRFFPNCGRHLLFLFLLTPGKLKSKNSYSVFLCGAMEFKRIHF